MAAATILMMLAACGGGDDRPSDADWQQKWARQQGLIPHADQIIEGGHDLCGEILGELRVNLPALLPTPTEALDEPVQAWISHAESIAFDCPQVRSELDERIRTIDLLATEIDAGLEADSEG